MPARSRTSARSGPSSSLAETHPSRKCCQGGGPRACPAGARDRSRSAIDLARQFRDGKRHHQSGNGRATGVAGWTICSAAQMSTAPGHVVSLWSSPVLTYGEALVLRESAAASMGTAAGRHVRSSARERDCRPGRTGAMSQHLALRIRRRGVPGSPRHSPLSAAPSASLPGCTATARSARNRDAVHRCATGATSHARPRNRTGTSGYPSTK